MTDRESTASGAPPLLGGAAQKAAQAKRRVLTAQGSHPATALGEAAAARTADHAVNALDSREQDAAAKTTHPTTPDYPALLRDAATILNQVWPMISMSERGREGRREIIANVARLRALADQMERDEKERAEKTARCQECSQPVKPWL